MGCGKSSVGRKLSQLLCCRFIDLDEVVEEVVGKRIPEIFASEGEAAFRRLETEVLTNILSAEHERKCAPCEVGRVNETPMTPVCASRIHPLAGGGMSSPSHLTPASPANESNTSSERNTAHNASGCVPAKISAVLALGGGTIMTTECAEMVRENTCCIYLRASVDTLLERLSSETSTRPLLTIDSHSAYSTKNDANSTSLHEVELNTPSRGTESDRSSQEPESNTSPRGAEGSGNMRHRIESLMSARTTTYEKAAHSIIDTDDKSIEQICSEILC